MPTWSLPKESFARWCEVCKPAEAVAVLMTPKKRRKATVVGFSEPPRADDAQLAAVSPCKSQQQHRNDEEQGEAAAEQAPRQQGSSNPGKELRKNGGDKGMDPAAEDDSGEDSTDWHADDQDVEEWEAKRREDYLHERKKTRYVKEMPSAEAIANFNWV